MVRVAMTEGGSDPIGGFTEVADRAAAYTWIENEARRRKRRVTGYTRTIVRAETRENVVDFGDYSMFGLMQFDTEEDATEILRLKPEPAPAPEPPKPGAGETKTLAGLPVTARELETALHGLCDSGRWDWLVEVENGKLTLREPDHGTR